MDEITAVETTSYGNESGAAGTLVVVELALETGILQIPAPGSKLWGGCAPGPPLLLPLLELHSPGAPQCSEGLRFFPSYFGPSPGLQQP